MASKRTGRPREFDRDLALLRAMELFWEHGYEPTTLADLTDAMGISAASLYAAFGSKQQLFDEAVRFYSREHRGFLAQALREEPTLRAGIARMLREAADAYTVPGSPAGCLIISGAVNCGSVTVLNGLREQRATSLEALRARIESGIARGELAEDADARVLAEMIGVALQGMAQQARDGTDRESLQTIADLIVNALPWRDGAGHDA
ncbi:TetR/AcrR family transcriptional regulator [Nocardia lijiangensis]|uniref:TetR/AcrR family transcriptional regulator n=1 Tax=Nocardia lijiangensis TaxID=299618 RepID=UPI000A02B25A|nr:TetR/AcrR family transcriptional regulator [Nocardia lijiangensis]